MSLHVVDPKSGDLSVFDEARAQIAEWEKTDPDAAHIVLILDGEELVVTVSGDEIRPSDAAGLCFAAAQAVLE